LIQKLPRKFTGHAPHQRKLIQTGYELLKPGGTLVYSTCTLRVEENEDLVGWVLRRFPRLQLAQQKIVVGNSPVRIEGLSDEEVRGCVQKFDPRLLCKAHANKTEGNDRNSDCSTECVQHALTHSWTKLPISFSEDYFLCPFGLDDANQDTIGFFIAKFIKR